ncbi:MAG: Hsp20/alpha crystallin family protein [Bacteroidia bacterium]|nr:Hsp20/alpha crystallin family protein [Bacteroidia bacterium]
MANIVKQNNQIPTFKNLIESFFEGEFPAWGGGLSRYIGSTIPSANIKETETDFQIEVGIPGVKKEDLKIDVEDDVLTISSEQREEKSEEKDNYTRREFNYSAFSRSFTLPDIVDADKISAEYKDGILNIVIPKKESVIKKAQKRIEIK